MSNVNDYNSAVIEEFRANGGQLGGNFAGAPMLLLHTTGAKSGAERVNPMMYLELDGHVYVFASKAGADTSPDWYHNLDRQSRRHRRTGRRSLRGRGHTAQPR